MATSTAYPTLTGLNNSTIVGTYRYDATKMTDLNSLYSLFKKDSFTTHKGMISLFNQRKLMSTPLLNLTELANSVMYVNGPEGKFRYSVPYDIGLPYILEDLTKEIDKPGIDGQKFKIKLSEDCFTNTDVLTYDFRDGVSLYVTEEEIYREGDGYVYTVMIPQRSDNKTTWFPKKYLQAGTEFFKISNANNEYDTQKSTVSMGQGILDLELQLGSERSVYHWITGYASMLKINDSDPRYRYMEQYGDTTKNNSIITFFNKDRNGKPIPNSLGWMPRIEAMLWSEMKMMEERDLTWSKGGIAQGSGRRSTRINTGLYEQLRNGNRVQYSKLTLALFEETLGNLYWQSGVPIEERKTIIQTGTAGLIEISKLLAQDYRESVPFVTRTGDVPGLLTGSAMSLGYGYRFVTKRFPVAGEVTFEYNAALDNRYNRTQDKQVGEYPLESHTFMILDVTDGRMTNAAGKPKGVEYRVENGFNDTANIVMVKPEGYADTYWGYEVGTQHPLGASAMKGMYSTSQKNGYAIWMRNMSSIWLKDATRTVLIEKKRS